MEFVNEIHNDQLILILTNPEKVVRDLSLFLLLLIIEGDLFGVLKGEEK